MKKALLIIAPENFRDEELFHTKEELEAAGVKTTIASTKSKARGMLGRTATADLRLSEVKVEDYDAIIFVGGSGSSVYFNDSTALSIAKEAFAKNKIVAAICIAPVILANAGVLKGKSATVWNGEFMEKIVDGGAKFVGRTVVVDGNVVTANGPQAAREFGRTIAKLLRG
ncbi:MAG: DJ-1/PfpI family protein [Candidatus Hadarchaeales archaeon]